MRTPARTVSAALLAAFVLACGLGPSSAATPGEPRIAFSAFSDATSAIWTIDGDGSAPRQVSQPPEGSGDVDPAWSPDRTSIAFVRKMPAGEDWRGDTVYRGDVWVSDAEGRGARRLARAAWDPVWSPDGSSIAFVRNWHIWTIDLDGRNSRQLTKGKDERQQSWSPDGRRIAFSRWTGSATELFVINSDGTGERRLLQRRVDSGALSWSPNGRRLSFFADTDPKLGDLDESLFVVDIKGGHLTRLGDFMFGESDMTPNWSRDGRRMMFVRYREPSPRTALYVMRADGTKIRRLTIEARDPEWSPDEGRIAFTRRSGLFVMQSDGSGVRRLAPASPLTVGAYIDW